jgi:hypothetical protein
VQPEDDTQSVRVSLPAPVRPAGPGRRGALEQAAIEDATKSSAVMAETISAMLPGMRQRAQQVVRTGDQATAQFAGSARGAGGEAGAGASAARASILDAMVQDQGARVQSESFAPVAGEDGASRITRVERADLRARAVGAQNAADATDAPRADWQAVSAPGAEHRVLRALAGDWRVTGEFAGAQGTTLVQGVMRSRWRLDGRWLEQIYEGQLPGDGSESVAFSGLGYVGYDRAARVFVASWMDTLSTSAVHSTGAYNAQLGRIVLTGSFVAPGGERLTQKQVIELDGSAAEGARAYTVRLSLIGADGRETPTGVVRYEAIDPPAMPASMTTGAPETGADAQP